MNSFEIVKEENRLLYSYIRGSHCHGINTPLSDIDKSGIFIAKKEDLLDLGLNYQPQIANETNDIVYYELKKFMDLLIKSNPTILEALFVDDKFVEFEHPLITELKKNKDKFITKKCFPSFFGYAESQIKKAKGLNKKINWDEQQMVRKTPFDFAYTFYKQGSTKIENWLDNRGLKQEFCGLVHIPNMHDTYGVYYDWGAHFEANDIKTIEDFQKNEAAYSFAKSFYNLRNVDEWGEWFNNNKDIKHYRGICLENSTDMRGSSVSKGEMPLCYIVYNENGYKSHCVKYKEYQDWIKHRNPIRYESNLKKSYDAKNMCECFRLIHCGIEIANGQGYIVNRSGIDAEFLLDVKNHKFEYEELIEKLNEDKKRMEEAMIKSTLKDDIDPKFINDLYLNMVGEFYFKS